MKKAKLKTGTLFLLLGALLLVWGEFSSVSAATAPQREREFRLEKVTAVPNTTNCTHRISNVWFTVSNWGFFGSEMQDPSVIDCETGQAAPSCQFPAGSNIEYLFQGALWVSAIVDGDTLMSCGTDGWWDTHELYPDEAGSITGRIWLRSTRPASAYPRNRTDCYPDQIDSSSVGTPEGEKFGIEAISEEDFIATYTDTHTASYVEVHPPDARTHQPLGLEFVQKTYAWSYEYAEDFFLIDFELTNILGKDLEEVWIALHVDADVEHISRGSDGAQDDMTGLLDSFTVIEGIQPLEILTAYIADVDGDPTGGVWDYQSCRGVSGMRVVRSPIPLDQVSFNWWISNTNAAFDWGPQRADNYRIYQDGNLGTPTGDADRHYAISNREFDYDQITCALNHEAEGWLPPLSPSGNANNLANGFDTRYTYSFGPFENIPTDSAMKVTVGYICGADFHVRPDDADAFIEAPDDEALVDEYYSRLDFADFAINATWAEWVFDNPGVDTDGDTRRGEYVLSPEGDTVWIKGDGVPDFAGPPPPPSPQLTFRVSPGVVTIIWNSLEPENEKDTFSGLSDFEGYKLYWSKTGRLDDYDLLAAYDYIDYDSIFHRSGRLKKWKKPPIRYEALKEKHPDIGFYRFPPYGPLPQGGYDTLYTPHSFNIGFGDSIDLELDPDREVILDSTTIYVDGVGDSTEVRWYSRTFINLLESQALYLAVTSFDYGNPTTQLSPIESSKAINATLLYPTATGEDITGAVFVFPNPYRIDGGYADAGFEDPDHSGWTPWDRRIYFGNLPEKCTIRIFTLDGDLVDTIEYDRSLPGTLEFAEWSLISRNTQAVVSGLYIFSVESESENYLGKFVIIK